MVNHAGGGIFSYATTGKGIQGDKYWIAKGISKDIDNCGAKEARAQIKSDQEPGIKCVITDLVEERKEGEP